MNIVWVTSEARPYAKTGGLADVCQALPEELSEMGHNVSVIMPYYPQLTAKLKLPLTTRLAPLGVPMGWDQAWCQVLEHKVSDSLSFYFVEHNGYFDRPFLYDYYGKEYSDNAARFCFLSRAAMQTVLALDLQPDILHCNDWQSALCCCLLKSRLYAQHPQFARCASVLTIHNIGYQGVFPKNNFYYTGLDWDFFNYTCLEANDQVNFLKGGVMCADMVNTVSPTYAHEILSPEFAFGLDPCLRHVNDRGHLRGILNGIDIDLWDPANDRLLPSNYHIGDLSGKRLCKEALQREFNLPLEPETPVFGLVTRLAYQKGVDVFANAIWEMLRHDHVQFVVLATGDPWMERRLSELASWYPGKFATYIGFNDYLSHLVEAGADMFVMPSRYEPCGLNQMYSMRYGTVPVVRATGGLDDTVVSYTPLNADCCTGFKFHDLYPEALLNTLRWSESVYKNQPVDFNAMVRNGMAQDFSWRHTALEYEALYRDAKKNLPAPPAAK